MDRLSILVPLKIIISNLVSLYDGHLSLLIPHFRLVPLHISLLVVYVWDNVCGVLKWIDLVDSLEAHQINSCWSSELYVQLVSIDLISLVHQEIVGIPTYLGFVLCDCP